MGQGGSTGNSGGPPGGPPLPSPPPVGAEGGEKPAWWRARERARESARRASERAQVRLESVRRVIQRGRVAYHWRTIANDWQRQMQTLANHPAQAAAALGAGSAVGLVTFGAGRLCCSFGLQSLRVSSSNRILATLGGGLALAACTTVAAEATLLSATLVAERAGPSPWPRALHPMSPHDPSFPAVSLLVIVGSWLQFRLLGGRVRQFAPSDVMRAGSFARKALPAPGNEYADARMKRLLAVAGGHHGCHSCGRSRSWWGLGPRLNFIGDHIPPNKYAKLADQTSGAVDTPGMPRGLWSRLSPFKPQKTKQVFLPQCERCSSIQSQAVRMDRRTLIFPRSWRLHDLWLPFPLLLALLLLPFLEAFRAAVDQEEAGARRSLAFASIKEEVQQKSSGWWPW